MQTKRGANVASALNSLGTFVWCVCGRGKQKTRKIAQEKKKGGVKTTNQKNTRTRKVINETETYPDEQLTPTTMLKISILYPECNDTTPNAYLPLFEV